MTLYCLQCASVMEYKQIDNDFHFRNVCTNCGYVHYENPKIVCGVIACWQDKILLCKRGIEPQLGKWTIPAGFMELNETLQQAAEREAYEEARVKLRISHLHCVYSKATINQVYIIFYAQMLADSYECTPESTDIRLLSLNKAQKMDLAFTSVAYALSCISAKGLASKQTYYYQEH